MKISYTILLGFFVILLLFSIATYLNYLQAEQVSLSAEKSERSSIIIRHSNRFQRNVLSMVSGLRGYLLTKESFFIQTYDSAINENNQILAELEEMVDEKQQEEILIDIRNLNSQWVQEFAVPLLKAKDLSSKSDSSMAAYNKLYFLKLAQGPEKELHRLLQFKFREFSNYEYRNREKQRETLTKSVRQTRTISFYLTMTSIVIGAAVAFFVAKIISSKVLKMVKMANEIAAGNINTSIPVVGSNEFSELAQALNSMAKTLSENFALLKRQNEDLDQFAHIAAHDIKAPLRGIANVADWIEEDHNVDLTPKVKEYLELIKGRVKRAENLLNGILLYSRISKEKNRAEVVDVNELIREVKENLPESPLRLHVQDNMPVMFAERIPLFQVFMNLIGNAFKYHDKANGLVTVYYKTEGDFYEFYVEDNGPGISPVYHQKIFKMFQTLQERDSFESTGVGLAIVKKILDERNLTIHIYSEPGFGCTFLSYGLKI